MRAIVVALALAVAASAFADVTMLRFTFKVPPEWTDKSPSSHAVSIFVDTNKGMVFNASVSEGGDAVDDKFLDKFAADSIASFKKMLPDGTMSVRKKEKVTIAGIGCARFEYDTNPGADKDAVRQLVFYIPVEKQHARLTYTTTPDKFAGAVPLFEKLARATKIAP